MTSTAAPVIHWFRNDLRLADNPALHAAAAPGPVLPLYIHDEAGAWAPGGATRWWLHGSLERLAASLAALGLPLVIRRGEPVAVLAELVAATGAQAIHWSRAYEPGESGCEDRLRARLSGRVTLRRFAGRLLHEPEAIRTGSGRGFQVFTPFWKACLAAGDPPPPLPVPALTAWDGAVASDSLADLDLLPRSPDWAGGLRAAWEPGEAAARDRLTAFLDGAAARYRGERDRPGVAGTSRLSPHLHFGEIGPRTVWHATRTAMAAGLPEAEGLGFLRELGWREFSAHLLWQFPTLPEEPLRAEFAAFPWSGDAGLLRAWQRGRTGYPIVDAGLRELWTTGWMHNRVRMIVASFLVKDLLVPWQDGERWFWDTLVDADLANNAASWQWVAGCGADAAPYFRVFNPVLQGLKFDPDGAYVRRWVPELAALPDARLHAPWEASPAELAAAGIVLGRDYPAPIVDHKAARQRALDAYAALRRDPGRNPGTV
jgi:deoxyribodipyrimidine photo-lyase